jgi:hypothetical protein
LEEEIKEKTIWMWRGKRAGSNVWSEMEGLPGIKEIAGKRGLGFGWGGVAMSRHCPAVGSS